MGSTLKLTNASIEELPLRPRAYIVYDGDLTGFACRVNPTGRRVWLVEYCAADGSKRRISFARADRLPANKARERARGILGEVYSGRDPARERAELRTAPTVGDLAVRFLAEEIEPRRKPGTAKLYAKLFRVHILPALSNRRARDIAYNDIDRLHRSIGARTPVTANRTVELIRALYNWAARAKELPKGHENPASEIRRFREEPRETFLDEDQLSRLGATLALAESDGLPYAVNETGPKVKHAPKPKNRRVRVSVHATGAIRLLLLTGCRLNEILTLRWSEVDLSRGVINLPDAKSKTGKRAVLINAPAAAVLHTLAEIRIGDYVVAGDDADKPRADLQRPWMQIRKHAKLDGVRLHDLRHTHASYGAGAGLGLPIIGRLLGHRQASTTARYSHLADAPARRASETIGSIIAAALGQPVEPPAEVVPLRKQRV